jgi:hypothetical protein
VWVVSAALALGRTLKPDMARLLDAATTEAETQRLQAELISIGTGASTLLRGSTAHRSAVLRSLVCSVDAPAAHDGRLAGWWRAES